MPNTLMYVAVAAGSVVLLYALILWLRSTAADAASASVIFDRYYTSAQRLLTDPSTPHSVVEFTEFFAERAGRPTLARRFATHVLRGSLDTEPKSPSPKVLQLKRDLDALNNEQREAFGSMIANGMISSAAGDPIFSRVFARILGAYFSKTGKPNEAPSPERANTAALDVSREREFACA